MSNTTTPTTFTTIVLAAAGAQGFTVGAPFTHGGRVTYPVGQPGAHGHFGAIYVGAKTGTITGAVVESAHGVLGRARGAREALGLFRG